MSRVTKEQQPAPAARSLAGVWVIAVVVWVEAMLLFAAADYSVIGLFTEEVISYGGGIFLAVICLLLGIALVFVGLKILQGYRWTRAAALVWQLVMIAVLVSLATSGLWGMWFALIPPIAAIVLLFTPTVVAATLRTSSGKTL